VAIIRLVKSATGSVSGFSGLNKMRVVVIRFPAKQKTAESLSMPRLIRGLKNYFPVHF
jgi:hypothetical protein